MEKQDLLYQRIETLKQRAERAEKALAELARIHHSTITGSQLHREDPSFRKCEALTCKGVAEILKDITHVEEVV